MKKISAILLRMLCMCDTAFIILKRSLELTCVMLLCSFALMVHIQESGFLYDLYMLAQSLSEMPAAILLIVSIGTAIIEEKASS